jgi:cellulose synthase/poly-beta-1,6-N-acetylglucosamine synthase-like glycosyltransferase
MLSGLIHIIENILYIYFAVCVGYIALFSIASCFFKPKAYPEINFRKRFALFIPAYREDAVIKECVLSALEQDYPAEKYHIIVISDHMQASTNEYLRQYPITLLEIQVEKSSKAQALRIAAEHIKQESYDYVVILDADNLIPSYYLHELNKTLTPDIKAIQTHRKAKNLNTDTAILDAVIEEMNNSIFRKGHVQLGFSSALIGSGMAFDAQWFLQNIVYTQSAGEDKELEELLLRQGIHIAYRDSLETLDEKVQKPETMRRQRRRWIAAQLFLGCQMIRHIPMALVHGNGDYLLKTIQALILPRSILVGFIGIISVTISILSPLSSIKWWFLLILLTVSLYLAIPSPMRHKYMGRLVKQIPVFIVSMIFNLFHLKGMAHKFTHTQHG